MTISEMKALAETVPQYDKKTLFSLIDRAQSGDSEAMNELTLALLPQLCAAYSHEIGKAGALEGLLRPLPRGAEDL